MYNNVNSFLVQCDGVRSPPRLQGALESSQSIPNDVIALYRFLLYIFPMKFTVQTNKELMLHVNLHH